MTARTHRRDRVLAAAVVVLRREVSAHGRRLDRIEGKKRRIGFSTTDVVGGGTIQDAPDWSSPEFPDEEDTGDR